MATIEIMGKTLNLDNNGHLANPADWTEDMAHALAVKEGIPALTVKHWTVLNYVRRVYKQEGAPPSVRRISMESNVDTKELYALFPGGPGKKAAKIAGLPKPKACI